MVVVASWCADDCCCRRFVLAMSTSTHLRPTESFLDSVTGNIVIGTGLGLIGGLVWKSYANGVHLKIQNYYAKLEQSKQ